MKLTLYDVTADFTGSLTVNGPDLLVSTTPGQNASVSFSVASTQSVRVHVGSSTYLASPCVAVRLMQGGTPLQTMSSCAATFDLNPQSLTTGPYTIVVDPGGALTGSLRLSVVSP